MQLTADRPSRYTLFRIHSVQSTNSRHFGTSYNLFSFRPLVIPCLPPSDYEAARQVLFELRVVDTQTLPGLKHTRVTYKPIAVLKSLCIASKLTPSDWCLPFECFLRFSDHGDKTNLNCILVSFSDTRRSPPVSLFSPNRIYPRYGLTTDLFHVHSAIPTISDSDNGVVCLISRNNPIPGFPVLPRHWGGKNYFV